MGDSILFLYLIYFVYGVCIGSFINVCIYRIPANLSVIYPLSFCPACGSGIKHRDLIPLVSYITLRGKCRCCGGKISLRYPAIELFTGLMFCILLKFFGAGLYGIIMCLLFSALTAIFFIDLEHRIIPDSINLFIAALGIVAMCSSPGNILDHILGALIVSIPVLAVAYLTRGFGLGDVKLFAAVGLLLGAKYAVLVGTLSIFTGGFFAVIMLLSGKLARKSEIPFGPFIVIGVFAACILGDGIISLYLY